MPARVEFRAIAALIAAVACSVAYGKSVVEERNLFEGGVKSNHRNRTFILSGAAAGGYDFVASGSVTGKPETAWGIFSRRMEIPRDAVSYSYEFEISADNDWVKGRTSGRRWGNAVNWTGVGDDRLGRRRLVVEFRKGDFNRFLFCGKIPENARHVQVQMGADGPNLPKGEEVRVRNAVFKFYPKGAKTPREIAPDLLPPLVKSRFRSPSPDPELEAVYQITDASAVDWGAVAVTDVVTKAAIPFVRRGDRIVLRPGRRWRDGRNLIDVSVRDSVGNSIISRKAFFVGERQCPLSASLRSDGMTVVNGKPFFPIGIFSVDRHEFNGNSFDNALSVLKKTGMNMVHSYTSRFDPELFHAAEKHGIRQWTLGSVALSAENTWFVSVGRTNRTVLAWYIGDDTSMHHPPGRIHDRDEAARMLDGCRITCHADVVNGGAEKSNLRDYVNFADVFMPELYPVDGTRDEACVAQVCRDMDRCRADIAEYGDGTRPRGIWPILQCFHGRGWHRYPTADEMYAMSFAALIHGGNGITWFKYGGDKDDRKVRYSGMFRTPDDWRAMTNIVTRISSLSPVLLERTPPQPGTPEIVSGASSDPFGQPAVTMLLKRHRGAVYVLAVNAAPSPVRAKFRIGRTPVRKGEVLWEKREVRAVNGVFEDAFDAFAVHVYRFGYKRRR